MRRFQLLHCFVLLAMSMGSCQTKKEQSIPPKAFKYFLGSDMSYLNQMEDCEGKFRLNGQEVEPFKLFADKGASIVRVRLWHTPSFGNYSNLADVKKTIRRAKEKKCVSCSTFIIPIPGPTRNVN